MAYAAPSGPSLSLSGRSMDWTRRDRRNALEIPHLAGPVKPRGRFVDVPGLDDGLLALGLLGLEGTRTRWMIC
ncbi:hypothetical protein N7513_008734 [Penicillium frequentans]|nr:hypothetical protein N7513_008734 [Penicillium glabrum]